jgi:hypothetical protein
VFNATTAPSRRSSIERAAADVSIIDVDGD